MYNFEINIYYHTFANVKIKYSTLFVILIRFIYRITLTLPNSGNNNNNNNNP